MNHKAASKHSFNHEAYTTDHKRAQKLLHAVTLALWIPGMIIQEYLHTLRETYTFGKFTCWKPKLWRFGIWKMMNKSFQRGDFQVRAGNFLAVSPICWDETDCRHAGSAFGCSISDPIPVRNTDVVSFAYFPKLRKKRVQETLLSVGLLDFNCVPVVPV